MRSAVVLLLMVAAVLLGIRTLRYSDVAPLPDAATTTFLALGVAHRPTARVNEPPARRILRPGRRTLPRPERPLSHGPP
ncbi:hypothetical protein ACGFSD_28715 [Streptomyces caniferus]|uniref:hypothetical protein n=1 Tax=Streptomyces caniferus TaxID=285557 RepID=UPI003711AC5C